MCQSELKFAINQLGLIEVFLRIVENVSRKSNFDASWAGSSVGQQSLQSSIYFVDCNSWISVFVQGFLLYLLHYVDFKYQFHWVALHCWTSGCCPSGDVESATCLYNYFLRDGKDVNQMGDFIKNPNKASRIHSHNNNNRIKDFIWRPSMRDERYYFCFHLRCDLYATLWIFEGFQSMTK